MTVDDQKGSALACVYVAVSATLYISVMTSVTACNGRRIIMSGGFTTNAVIRFIHIYLLVRLLSSVQPL